MPEVHTHVNSDLAKLPARILPSDIARRKLRAHREGRHRYGDQMSELR